jgi:hypothetical protein
MSFGDNDTPWADLLDGELPEEESLDEDYVFEAVDEGVPEKAAESKDESDS